MYGVERDDSSESIVYYVHENNIDSIQATNSIFVSNLSI